MLITYGIFGLECHWFGKISRLHVLLRRYVFGGNMSSYKKLFECVRPDFICNLTATRTEEQGVLKLTLRSEHENVELYGFEDLADSVSWEKHAAKFYQTESNFNWIRLLLPTVLTVLLIDLIFCRNY